MVTTKRDTRGFERAAEQAAMALKRAKRVLVVGHIDADGITASSIASAALHREGVEHTVRFVKKLDEAEIARINAYEADLVWLVDLGSGSFSRLDPSKVVVTDHHRPDPSASRIKVDLFSFAAHHVNPHLYGMDGSAEISGAGTAYAVAKAMDPRNRDLAPLAIIGAVGDFQDNSESRLIGYNRTILEDAVSTGLLRAEIDLRLFGRETRPLHALIQFSTDPALLPVLRSTQAAFRRADCADDEDNMLCMEFLRSMEVETKEGDRWRSWNRLGLEEKRRVASELCRRLLDCGKGTATVRRLVGEVYCLAPGLPGTPPLWKVDELGPEIGAGGGTWHPNARALMDAKEFATLLNACGRHDRPEVGKAVCLGDRGEALAEALRNQDSHRESLKRAIRLVKEGGENGIREDACCPSLRYFHGQDLIEDTIVGIVAGMLLGSPEVPSDRPLFAFAQASDGTCTLKVSARGTRDLVRRGLDLSAVMRVASESVGGSGGGHNIAAGATIPEGTEKAFLTKANEQIQKQLTDP